MKCRFYILMAIVVATMAAGYALPVLFSVGKGLLAVLAVLTLVDGALLWSRRGVDAVRLVPERFSNGDANSVRLHVESRYPFAVAIEVIDEVPFVFQRRDVSFRACLASRGEATLRYTLTPTLRGVYGFGRVRVFVATCLGLMQRRYTCGEPVDVKVYPSFLMLRQYELLAMSNNLTETGIKRIRRIGNNTDFEQIRDYIAGDDFRTINWKATARRSLSEPRLMVNIYQEERSQQVYCVIDKGRLMQQAFAVAPTDTLSGEEDREVAVAPPAMTLLDYAINASLVLSFVAMNKQDKAGLVTFSDTFATFVPASRQVGHLQTLQEALYAEQTQFAETDFSALLAGLSRHVSRRSLLVLFTSFTSMVALRRQLGFLRQIGRSHRLLVVFFEDDELRSFVHDGKARTTADYYQRVVAERFRHEQQLVAQTLRQYGIQALLTPPNRLSVSVINKYLELKSN